MIVNIPQIDDKGVVRKILKQMEAISSDFGPVRMF